MIVNGITRDFEGYSFSEIGREFQRASPNKDGIGLVVVLTEVEESVFKENFGMFIGKAICELVFDAVKEVVTDPPKAKYEYSNRIFMIIAN